jgi:hypothetical protein
MDNQFQEAEFLRPGMCVKLNNKIIKIHSCALEGNLHMLINGKISLERFKKVEVV